eukprot:CAMPEP_0185575516 /NCGR_PEP_ID=MMETSP0434-20130131/6689_1 /TAXON_ID=626734 ORGANISM="Favella taraikaensis, Strain Fe Narragansett Bay" /NCGR_SAMPLE_ID=MMETSP0434 /ASSEMBLY_ACC=CAM_ASM_000379 /LENGTH=128 /DNA_ID=CAMNT_0028192419 /DNA_START=53 /DNA_END=439 /DNA_ORIENTATION=+
MVKDSRVTYRRRCSYATKSNKIRVVKTPGGRLVAQYTTKTAKPVRCAIASCGTAIAGVPIVRPVQMGRISKHRRSVSRAYGGNLCATCLRDRIMRAFIVEEQKIVKKVMQEKKALEKVAKKEKAGKKK